LTLTKQARDAIARAVGRLRTLFEDEFSAQASGRFGLHVERQPGLSQGGTERAHDEEEQLLRPWVEPLAALSLSPAQATQRAELIGALGYLTREGLEGGEAVARVIREAAFTAVNRLLAVRVGEAVGAFGELTARGRSSTSYREIVVDLFPVVAQAEDEGFWHFLQVAGDELGATVPLLFDRRLPVSAFVPSRTCVDAALEIVNDAEVATAWVEPEALGWSYQFFNSEEERQEMRDAARAPRDARELAIRNQFFTPRYVVDWLTQNTLGRRLREAGFSLELPLLTDRSFESSPLSLDEVRVLDPACGSGHFLLGCYDLLERAWEEQGVDRSVAAPRILNSLYGVDIDPRASQVAQAVLVLRARRSAPSTELQPPTIVTARPLPASTSARQVVFDGLSPNARDLAHELDSALTDTPNLGSLLKVEQRMAVAFKRVLTRPKLDAAVEQGSLEAELVLATAELASQADSSPANRMFAADARDAVRFSEVMRQRYDVVLMNPPFGRPVASTLAYLKAAYGASSVDLYAAFVSRGVDLLEEDGYGGAITSRTGFFQASYEGWRAEVIPRLDEVLDLGLGVMEGALVEAAAYVFTKAPRGGDQIRVRRVIECEDKSASTYALEGEAFEIDRSLLAMVPTQPLAYWATPELLAVFQKFGRLEGNAGSVRQGLITAEDFRFLRLWWEIEDRDGWPCYPKGGAYVPFYVDIATVVDWRDDGRALRSSDRARVQNTDYYLRPGVTWTLRSGNFGPQALPEGCITSMRSLGFFPKAGADVLALLGWAQSSHVEYLVKLLLGWASRPEYKTGAVQLIPYPGTTDVIAELAARGWRAVRSVYERDERSMDFVGPSEHGTEAKEALIELLEVQRDLDSAVGAQYGVMWQPDASHVTAKARANLPRPMPGSWISFLVGCAFDRWKVSALKDAGDLRRRDPFEAMSDRSPLSQASGTRERRRVFVDEQGHERDLISAIEREAAVAGLHDRVELELRELGAASLRGYMQRAFFDAHVQNYSVASRNAPVYWQLSVPSGQWSVWIYALDLSREVLFEVVRLGREKLKRVSQQAMTLRGRPTNELSRDDRVRLEVLERVVGEVEDLTGVVERVAQSGWVPDLHDGLELCAAPLMDAFVNERWLRELAIHNRALNGQKYAWATVQREYFRRKK
jgi:hypothetical protein